MRRFVYISLLLLGVGGLMGCRKTPSEQAPSEQELIRSMVCMLHAQYPQATLQDVYKTCYQDFFGAEHAAPDSATALLHLRRELAEMEADSLYMPSVEPCGYHHRYERVSLRMVADGTMSEQTLLSRFVQASSSSESPCEDWAATWSRIEQTAVAAVPEWDDPSLRAALHSAALRQSPVHHSEAFRRTYHPHYRIVRCLPSNDSNASERP